MLLNNSIRVSGRGVSPTLVIPKSSKLLYTIADKHSKCFYFTGLGETFELERFVSFLDGKGVTWDFYKDLESKVITEGDGRYIIISQ